MIAMPSALPIPLRMDEGNVIRIGNTRVTLQAVIADFHRGASPEQIVENFDVLMLPDVYLVIGYYLQNRAEVDAYIEEQRALATEARHMFEAEFPPHEGLSERISAYKAQRQTT